MSSSREAGARSLCVRVTQCTARGERQRDYATSTVDSQRRGANQGKEACMRRSERAVRTPWRQERRQRHAQERRHLSSAMRHRWGRALTRARSEHPGGLHRPQKGPGGEAHRNPSLFVRSWPLGAGAVRWPCHGHGPGRRGGCRGCQGRTRLRKWLPFYVLEPHPGPLTPTLCALVFCLFEAATPPERKEKHCFFISPERIRGRPVGDARSRAQ